MKNFHFGGNETTTCSGSCEDSSVLMSATAYTPGMYGDSESPINEEKAAIVILLVSVAVVMIAFIVWPFATRRHNR